MNKFMAIVFRPFFTPALNKQPAWVSPSPPHFWLDLLTLFGELFKRNLADLCTAEH